EDWVEAEDGYHNFLLTRNIHPSSFKIIAANRKCVLREGSFYRVVEAAYTAWLFSETPPKDLANLIFKNPELTKRIALYDLSPLSKGKKVCLKLNFTDSLVFNEFENFLREELKVKLKPCPTPRQKPKMAFLQSQA
ncbi:MAG: hypothetical protein QXK33_04035, partial [Candidatus Bathyarchaeia archaeon]